MRGVSFEADGSVRIGALTKLVEISENEALAQYGGLREACSRRIPQIRNQATIGGNVLQEKPMRLFQPIRKLETCGPLLPAGRRPLLSVSRVSAGPVSARTWPLF